MSNELARQALSDAIKTHRAQLEHASNLRAEARQRHAAVDREIEVYSGSIIALTKAIDQMVEAMDVLIVHEATQG